MAGRPKKEYPPIYRSLYITTEEGQEFELLKMPIHCPVCGSTLVGTYGLQRSMKRCIDKFQCKNPLCPHLKTHEFGKQFNLYTSGVFSKAIKAQVNQVLPLLLNGKTTQSALGRFFHRSPALITYLRQKIERHLETQDLLKNLVLSPTLENAAAIDETFLKIGGKAYYLILITGYGSGKVLGLKLSRSRDAGILREVFDEAERNNGKPFEMLTGDGWGAYQTLAKELFRPFILVVHKHKTPYDKAVIWHIKYREDVRIIHKIGIKTDFFKRRGKREYFLEKITESTVPKIKQKRGRPKGVKNGQGNPKPKKRPKMKRGRKGVHSVFKNGKKGYAYIDPWRKKVRIRKGGSKAVAAALNAGIQLFAGITIQNNIAENKNSVVKHYVWFSGRKTPASMEKRLRTFFFYHNNPERLDLLHIAHTFRGDMFYKQIKGSIFGDLINAAWGHFSQLKKGGRTELIIQN